MQQKQQICRDHRNDYASELAKTNQFQQQHYHTHMPAIFDVRLIKTLINELALVYNYSFNVSL